MPHGKKLEVAHIACPGNLQLIKDYQNSTNLSVATQDWPVKAMGKRVPGWLLQDSEPEAAQPDVNWHKLMADTDETNNDDNTLTLIMIHAELRNNRTGSGDKNAKAGNDIIRH